MGYQSVQPSFFHDRSHPTDMHAPDDFAPGAEPTVTLRPATRDDLDTVNQLIGVAVMTWALPERVKRLALPSYHYHAYDLEHLQLRLACVGQTIAGVAAWEAANPRDCPDGLRGLLLHGLYVAPAWQRRGIGRRLLDAAKEAARAGGYAGVLVKMQPDAIGFFTAQGLQALPILDPNRDYPHRYWHALTA